VSGGGTGYPPRLQRLSVARPGSFELIRYGTQADQFGELWPSRPSAPAGPSPAGLPPAGPSPAGLPPAEPSPAGLSPAGPAPVAALIHGGYWRAAYRLDLMHGLAADLCSRGFAVWNLEYRRAGAGGGWPATFADIASGLDALAGLAGRHHLDVSRVTVIGHSAGGQLALWAAARLRLPSAWPRPQVLPAHVVSLAGVCDLTQAARLRLSNDAVPGLLGGTPEQVPDVYAAACPRLLLPLGARQTVVHGSSDDNVPFMLSAGYAAAARQAGDPCEFLPLPGADHFDLIDPATPAWAAVIARVCG
jgi:acetyl esterase/lipase